MKTVAFILIFAVVGLFGGSSTSHAQTNGTVNNGNFTYNCTSSVTVGYGTYPGTYAYPSPPLDLTTINGNITVNGHCTLILQFAYVTGNIQVQNGGSLLISAYGEPTTIDGNVQATNCVTSLLEGNVTVKGNYQIQNCDQRQFPMPEQCGRLRGMAWKDHRGHADLQQPRWGRN